MSVSNQPMDVVGVSTILLSRGRIIRIADIHSVEIGLEILQDLSAAILAIETRIEDADPKAPGSADLVRRAEKALKIKRRQRPAVEYRLGEIRRAERAARAASQAHPDEKLAGRRRRAFIAAAQATLSASDFDDLWKKARELRPEAWATAGDGQ